MSSSFCLDYNINTHKPINGQHINYYILTKELWKQINPQIKGMLRIKCVKKRFVRSLKYNG